MLIAVALILLVLGGLLLLQSNRQRRASGLPGGRIIYSDAGAWTRTEKPFYDAELGLTGKPDYIVEHNGTWLPVEVKSGYAPSQPHEGHIYQLAAYCHLIERTSQRRPEYGILVYRNRTFAIDYTPALEAELVELLAEMRLAERRGACPRSHTEPARCNRCGYRSICDQKL